MAGPLSLDANTAVRTPTNTTVSTNSNSHTTVTLGIDDQINGLSTTPPAAGRNAILQPPEPFHHSLFPECQPLSPPSSAVPYLPMGLD
jgi:hypothetical protein